MPKQPFSGAKKKALLKSKREQKKRHESDSEHENVLHHEHRRPDAPERTAVVTSFGGGNLLEARLATLFLREANNAVAARRARGSEPFRPREAAEPLEGRHLPHPVRPDWSGVSPDELDAKEQTHFKQWCEDTFDVLKSHGDDLAPFELNLEVWRQLWRVLEQSDVVILVVDVRNPGYHIPDSLVHDIVFTRDLRLVIALTKVDLVEPNFAHKWKKHLLNSFPGVAVVEFSSKPKDDAPGGLGKGSVTARRKWLKRRIKHQEIDLHEARMARMLLQASLGGQGPSPEQQNHAENAEIQGRAGCQHENEDDEDDRTDAAEPESDEDDEESEADGLEERDMEQGETRNIAGPVSEVRCDGYPRPVTQLETRHLGRGPGGAVAIGLVGHPNVGKTSVLNVLAGRKAASVGSTAGVTKHLQHIRVLEEFHPHAYVIDCPGLVFPALRSRALAELYGSLPLAQVREPMSAIRILGERLPLVQLYRLEVPEWYLEDTPSKHCELKKGRGGQQQQQQPVEDVSWSPLMVLEAYCEKLHYMLPRSGAPDVHRAGLEILKDATDGALLLTAEPPNDASPKPAKNAAAAF
eukprot:TRINITY_DN23964_c0_g2_i1.p1 TRINITY_DN23964_c0_g2~~TRINITY_DN23964_c0_g2_i1.p1  ORF type:complete len:580 (+),score=102.39 TRINITY_DN23964_c0_g2_i1:223-1962(+)